MLEEQYNKLIEELETCGRDTPRFVEIFQELIGLAEAGFYDACEVVAEFSVFESSIYDPEAAYFWYFIAYKHQGYSTAFQNESSPPGYLGTVGDFRNESMVAGLVEELGIEKIKILDSKAESWILAHPTDCS